MKNKLEGAVLIDWIESERGWGIRPDGCSLHLTKKDADKYIEKYWKNMPNEVPNEYSRPISDATYIKVNSELYKKVEESEYGIRLWRYNICNDTREIKET